MSLGNLVPSKFQLEKISRKHIVNGNYTDENALIKANPDVPYWSMNKESVLDYVASASPNIYAKPGGLYKHFMNGGIEMVESSTYRHKLRGTGKVKCVAVENIMKGVATPGYGFQHVFIKLDQRLYKDSDHLYPEKDPSVRFRVDGNETPDGTGFIYKLKLITQKHTDFVSPDLLKAGVVWKKGGASFSEASGAYGSTRSHGTSILTFENQLGSFSKQYEVTDQAYLYAMRLKGKDAKGNLMKNFPDQILPMPEAEFFAQCRYEQENEHFWGRSSGKNIIDGTTGLHARTGEGIVEYFEDGNWETYHRHNFSLDSLFAKFRRFAYGKVEPGKANWVIWCGLGLLELVSEAGKREYAMRPVEHRYEDNIESGSNIPGSHLKGKRLTDIQILEFDIAPYGRVTFKHLPMLDDTESYGGRTDPKTGYPETSYWGFLNDLGMGTGPNIKLLRRKESEQYTYVCGALSPVGYINRKSGKATGYHSAHAKRTYSVHYGIQEGITCKDTKKTMFLHPTDKF